MNQSPVSFLDCTICWMKKTLLHVSLVPDRLLSALIKTHTKCHGTMGRKRLIVTIYHIFTINLSGSVLCNQRKFAKAFRTKESVYNFLSLTLSLKKKLLSHLFAVVPVVYFCFCCFCFCCRIQKITAKTHVKELLPYVFFWEFYGFRSCT